jgi:Flp pilus assembly protein TadG
MLAGKRRDHMEGRVVTDTKRVRYGLRYTGSARASDERGIAALELALILPILLVLAFAVIDLGRFIQARLVIANVSREGGSLATRVSTDFASSSYFTDVLNVLMSASSGLNLQADGKIYISRITAGKTSGSPNPVRFAQETKGSLASLKAATTVGTTGKLGLSNTLYAHLVFNAAQATADIAEVTVVEVFYKYRPITPLPRFISGLLLGDVDGEIINSKAVF